MDSCILSGDMKIFVHHIYELQKGIRYMALCTIDKEDFILGTMLGYDVCQQCERYNHRKTLIQSA